MEVEVLAGLDLRDDAHPVRARRVKNVLHRELARSDRPGVREGVLARGVEPFIEDDARDRYDFLELGRGHVELVDGEPDATDQTEPAVNRVRVGKVEQETSQRLLNK